MAAVKYIILTSSESGIFGSDGARRLYSALHKLSPTLEPLLIEFSTVDGAERCFEVLDEVVAAAATENHRVVLITNMHGKTIRRRPYLEVINGVIPLARIRSSLAKMSTAVDVIVVSGDCHFLVDDDSDPSPAGSIYLAVSRGVDTHYRDVYVDGMNYMCDAIESGKLSIVNATTTLLYLLTAVDRQWSHGPCFSITDGNRHNVTRIASNRAGIRVSGNERSLADQSLAGYMTEETISRAIEVLENGDPNYLLTLYRSEEHTRVMAVALFLSKVSLVDGRLSDNNPTRLLSTQ